ncbi:hypothetical protein L208DRAFT_1244406, partial [Tricholoma matsutake]
QGFLQNELILATFTNAHLAHLATDHPGDEKPIGALILLMQAVGHALSCYAMGLLKQDHTPASHFSADNYGDRVECVKIPSGHRKFKQRRDNHATQYIATVKAFKEDHWNDIFEISWGLMTQKRKSHPSLSSRASSEDIVMEDIILLSDD